MECRGKFALIRVDDLRAKFFSPRTAEPGALVERHADLPRAWRWIPDAQDSLIAVPAHVAVDLPLRRIAADENGIRQGLHMLLAPAGVPGENLPLLW